jgi:hypothetical protein
MHCVNKKGVLANSTPLAVAVAPGDPPFTATLDSSASGRLIELSSDSGTNYYVPATITDTNFIQVQSAVPITHVRFTGATGDRWILL